MNILLLFVFVLLLGCWKPPKQSTQDMCSPCLSLSLSIFLFHVSVFLLLHPTVSSLFFSILCSFCIQVSGPWSVSPQTQNGAEPLKPCCNHEGFPMIKGPLLFFQVFEKVKTKSGWNCQPFCGTASAWHKASSSPKRRWKGDALLQCFLNGFQNTNSLLSHGSSLGGNIF